MELLEAIKSRRSVRAYKPDPVPVEVLTELPEVARWAPPETQYLNPTSRITTLYDFLTGTGIESPLAA